MSQVMLRIAFKTNTSSLVCKIKRHSAVVVALAAVCPLLQQAAISNSTLYSRVRKTQHMYSSAGGLRFSLWGGGGLKQTLLYNHKSTATKIHPSCKSTPRNVLVRVVLYGRNRRLCKGQNVKSALVVAARISTIRSRDFLWAELNGGSLFLVDKQWQLQGSHLDPPHRLWRCPGKQHQNGFRQYTHRAVDFWWVKEIGKCVMVVLISPNFLGALF